MIPPKPSPRSRAARIFPAAALLIGLSALPGAPLAAPNDFEESPPDAVCLPPRGDVFGASAPLSSSPPVTPLHGGFEVTSDGAGSYQIPLTVVPGRAGMAPSLSINYSSNNDEEGMLGVGFAVSGLSTIERCAKNLDLDGKIEAIRFDSDDALCLDGNRLVWTGELGVQNGMTYKAFRTRVDGGDRVLGYWSSGPNGSNWDQFEVFHRSGLISSYGAVAEARVMAKNGVAASWLEDRRRDRRDNAIVFHYQNDLDPNDGHSLEVVPSEIAYTDHPSQGAQRRVVFEYGSLGNDARPLVTYRDGLRKHTSKRLEHVRMMGPAASTVRSYHLSYDKSTTSKRDRLREVKECAKDSDADAHCRPPVKFEWSAPEPGGPVKMRSTPVLIPPTSSSDTELQSFDYHMADVNGDGLDDVVTIQMSGFNHIVSVALATGGLEAQPFAAPEVWAAIPKAPGFLGYGTHGKYKVEIGDLDSDGNMDLMIDEPFHAGGSYFWLRAVPASKTFVLTDTGIPRQNYPDGVPVQLQEQAPDAFQSIRYVDLDGDGVLDALSCRDGNLSDWDDDNYDAAKVTWRLRLGVPGTGTFGAPDIVNLDHTSCTADIREVDLDGDGKIELVRRLYESPPLPPGFVFTPTLVGPYIKSGLVASTMYSEEIEGLDYYDAPHVGMSQLRFADVNNDGLPDAIHLVGWELNSTVDGNDLGAMIVQHNTGRGFAMGAAVVSPTIEHAFHTSGAEEVQTWFDYWYSRGSFFDMNGDGRADLLTPWEANCAPHSCYGVVALNARFDSVAAGDYLKATTQVLDIPFLGVPQGSPPARYRPHFADVNGDGRTDFLAPDLNAPGPNDGRWLAVYQMAAARDRVIAIHDGTNPKDPEDAGYLPTVAISYGNLVDLERTWAGINTENVGSTLDGTLSDPKERYRARANAGNDCQYPRKCLVGTRQVVKSYAIENGIGGAKNYAVQLRDGRYDVRSRQGLGFGALRIIDTDTLAGHASFFDNVTYDATLHAYPYTRQVNRSWKWTPPLPTQDSQRLTVEYGSRGLLLHAMPARYFTVPFYTRTRVDETDFNIGMDGYAGLMHVVEAMEGDPGDVLRDSTRLITNFDEFGNVLTEHEQTVGVDDVRLTRHTYQNDTNAWILSRETETRVCSQSLGMEQCRLTERQFNTFGELSVVRVGDAGSPATRLDTTYLRDAFGNVTLTRQLDGYSHKRSTCTGFDSEGVFPVMTANSLGHVSRARYHAGLGVVTDRIDPNGLTTQIIIDELGRTTESRNMDGTWRKASLSRFKASTPNGDAWRMTSTIQRSDGATESATMDSHGRTIKTTKAAPVGPACAAGTCVQNGTIVTDVTYDDRGLVATRSMPHLLALGSIDEHFYAYDALGREVYHVTPWGSKLTTRYLGNSTKRYTPLGLTKIDVDSLGRETTITDAQGGTTQFTYGPFGNPWYVDTMGSVTASVFDAYGRRVVHTDPDRGMTTFEYDGYGQKLYEVDALARSYTFIYDALGRIANRFDPDGTTTWIYDAAAFGKGKPYQITSPTNVRETYAYDTYGRPNATTVEVGGESFSTSLEYDPLGRLETITYPEDEFGDNQIVKNEYDGRGYLTEVKALLPDPDQPGSYSWKGVWKLGEVDGGGRVRRFTLGNGVETFQSYSQADTTLRKIETKDASGNSIQSLLYQYNDALLLEARYDELQGTLASGPLAERFEYDKLGRLECGYFGNARPHACPTALEYEPNGNIHKKSGVGTYTYHPNHPHAVQTAGNLGFEYDAVGNQVGRPGINIDYTAFDLPSRYTLTGGAEIDFLYSGSQARVRKISDEEEQTTIGRYYDRRVDLVKGDIDHRYRIFSPEREVAAVVRRNGKPKVEYEHTDHLGSLDAVTDENGDVTQRLSFDAFGAQRDPVWGNQGTLAPIDALGFAGHEHDTEVGLINMRGRLYDPLTGRFLSVDPKVPSPRFTQSWNPYTYVLNSPLSLVDPDGLAEKDPPNLAAREAIIQLDESVDADAVHYLVTLDDGTDFVVTLGEVNDAIRADEQKNGAKRVQDEICAPEAAAKSGGEPIQRSSQAGAAAGSAAAPASQAGKAPPAPAPPVAPSTKAETPQTNRPTQQNCDECATFNVGGNFGVGAGVYGSVEGGHYLVPSSGEAGVYGSAGVQYGLVAAVGGSVSIGVTFDRKDAATGRSETLNISGILISYANEKQKGWGDVPRITGVGLSFSVPDISLGQNFISLGSTWTWVHSVTQSWSDITSPFTPKAAPLPTP